MSLMCSLQVCKAQEGPCGHEKMMAAVALLLIAGGAYYYFLS